MLSSVFSCYLLAFYHLLMPSLSLYLYRIRLELHITRRLMVLLCTGLSFRTTEDTLRKAFEQFGKLTLGNP